MGELGRIIAKAREDKGLHQTELAQRAGVSQSNISLIEAGKTDQPKPSTLESIGRVLDLDPERLKLLAGIRTKDAVPTTPEEERIQELARSLTNLPRDVHELIMRASSDKKSLRILQLLSILARLPEDDQAKILAAALAMAQTRTEVEPSPNTD